MTSTVRRGTVVSAFAGAGGLDLGLERAGFDSVLSLDTDASARSTLKLNRPSWNVPDDGDVSSASDRIASGAISLVSDDIDLLAGGPPCQPYSKAAQWTESGRSGMSDPRAKPLHGMLSLVELLQPRAVLIENVPGFVAGTGSAFRSLQLRLAAINKRRGCNYRASYRIVDAADFGVPQRRKRAIVVAFRDGTQFSFPDGAYKNIPITAWEALSGHDEIAPPVATGSWTGLLPAIPEGSNYLWLTARGGGPEVFGWRTRYWSFLLKLARDKPSWTLPASPGPNTGPFHWDNRPLSVRERMRIQSFSDDWSFSGGQRDQIRLAGNATPPLLAECMGRQIAVQLGLEVPPPSATPQSRSAIPPPGEVAKVLPSRYLDLIGPKEAHGGEGLGPRPRKPMAVASPPQAS